MKQKFIDSYKMLSSHEGTLFVYAFAYALIVGIAPFLIVAVLVTSNLLLDMDAMIEMMSHYIPSDLIMPFITYVKEVAPSDIILIISLSSVSFWVASKSVYSFLLEATRIDEIEVKGFALRIISVVYFILILLGAMLVVLLLKYLPPYNYITVPLLLWLMMMSFYRLISFRFSSFSDVYMGSALASSALIILGRLFFVYVNEFSNFENVYGPLASLMILLISIYYVSYIIYFGFCINVIFFDERETDTRKRKLAYKLSELNPIDWIQGLIKK